MIERATYTVDEVSKILGIGRQLAYQKTKDGSLPVLKIGKRILVPRQALLKLLAEPPKQKMEGP